jgi:4'-phosphopantetheinyl transferase EntD
MVQADSKDRDSGQPEGFVCRVVSAGDAPSERLLLQEAAIAPKGGKAEVSTRFKLGRIAARRCLQEFGAQPSPILAGPKGEPLFPQGFVGSISHTKEIGAAVVGRAAEYMGLGLDIEELGRKVDRRVIDRIGTAQEKRWVKEEPERRGLMVFCAKESIFKALYPLHKQYMKFLDVATHWNEDDGVFVSTLLTDFGAPWDAGATVMTLCGESNGLLVAVTVIESQFDD